MSFLWYEVRRVVVIAVTADLLVDGVVEAGSRQRFVRFGGPGADDVVGICARALRRREGEEREGGGEARVEQHRVLLVSLNSLVRMSKVSGCWVDGWWKRKGGDVVCNVVRNPKEAGGVIVAWGRRRRATSVKSHT